MSSTQKSGDWSFTVKDNTVILTKYEGSSTSVQVPEQLQGMSVVEIGSSCFKDNTKIKSINIPGCVKKIGGNAFTRCKVSSVTLGQGVKVIESRAFDANEVENLVLPEGLTTIENEAFRSNFKLTGINLPGTLTSIGNGAFQYCKNITALNIPSNSKLKTIGANAFQECKIKELAIPGSVKTIGASAFKQNGLVRLTLSEGLTKICTNAFSMNSIGGNITIPESVTLIENEAFKENQITGLCIRGKIKLSAYVFLRNQISTLILGRNVDLTKAANVFISNKLTSVTVPEGVNYDGKVFDPEVKIFVGDTDGLSFGGAGQGAASATAATAPATPANAERSASPAPAQSAAAPRQAARLDQTFPTFHNEKGQYIGGTNRGIRKENTTIYNTSFQVGTIKILKKGATIADCGKNEWIPPETVGLVTNEGIVYMTGGEAFEDGDYLGAHITDDGEIKASSKKMAEKFIIGRVVEEGDVGGVYNKDGVRVGEVRDAADWKIVYGGAMLVIVINWNPKTAPLSNVPGQTHRVPLTADEYEQQQANQKPVNGAPGAAEKKGIFGALKKLIK